MSLAAIRAAFRGTNRGHTVVAEVPHSEGPPLSEVRGLMGTVLESEMTPDGRVYDVEFDMKRQVKIGTDVVVKARKGRE